MGYAKMTTALAGAIALATAVTYTYEQADRVGQDIVAEYQTVMADYTGAVDDIIADLKIGRD